MALPPVTTVEAPRARDTSMTHADSQGHSSAVSWGAIIAGAAGAACLASHPADIRNRLVPLFCFSLGF